MAVSKFGSAFASARKSGKKTFEYGGKSYTTETKNEKKAGVPRPRKDRPSGKAPVKGVNKVLPADASRAPKKPVKLKGKVADLPSRKLKNGGRPTGFSTTKYTGPGKKK